MRWLANKVCEAFFDVSIGGVENPFKSWTVEKIFWLLLLNGMSEKKVIFIKASHALVRYYLTNI